MIFVGLGMGLVTPTVIGRLATLSQTNNSGKVMGGYSVAFNMGVFCSSLIMTPVIEKMGSYQSSFLIVGIIPLAVCIVCLISGTKARSKVVVKDESGAFTSRSEYNDEVVFKKILIATDGSDNSKYAVKNGLKIAKNNSSNVTVLYVFDPEIYVNSTGSIYSATELKQIEDSLSKEAITSVVEEGKSGGINITSKVLIGYPANVIVEESKD
jgi:MFS family permease